MRNRVRLLLTIAALCCSLSSFAQKDTTVVVAKAPMADYASPKKYLISSILVEGVKYHNLELLMNTVGLYKGDTINIPSDYVSQAITKLWNMRYFSDVKVLAQPLGGDSLRLEVYLKERLRVYSWQFTGVRKGEMTDMLDNVLKLRKGAELSNYVIDKNIILIKKHYEGKGFLNVEVTPKVKNDTNFPNAAIVTFAVSKNKRVKIGKIDFEGNELMDDGRLKRSFKKTHQKSIKFWEGSKLKDAEYEEDKENLVDFYNSKGYRNANILYDSIYKINDKRIGIKIGVEEGNKYYYRNITWVGNSIQQTKDLSLMLGVISGDTYDKKSMHKRLGIGKEGNPDDMSITSLYQNDGYLFFSIDPAETIIGADSIDLELKIYEGKQATINNVGISGNTSVNDAVIRRELFVKPGELYNRALLMQTLRMLSQMEYFNPESMIPDVKPVSNELVDISFPLEEKSSDKFEISGGWGADMFVGSVGIELTNFSIRNTFNKNEWRPYPKGQAQKLQLRAQSNGSYYKSFSASFTEPWLGGRKPHSLTLGAFYSSESNAYYFYQQGSQFFTTLGVSAGVGRRLTWPDPNFSLYMELGYQRYKLQDWERFFMENGVSNIFTLKTVFGRSSVDQPTYPRRGSDFSVSVTLTPPYSLFDGKDYSDTSMSDQERYKWIEYHKWLLKAQWYYPLTQNNKTLVLMARAEMGYIGSYNRYKPSPFEGFEVGGDGMTGYNLYGVDVIGLRGYDNGSLTPLSSEGGYARAYNKYTVELRFPVIMEASSTIYALAFAEAGNAFSSWAKFDPFLLKRSAGVGVRMFLPVVGMLGVDWAYGFDRAPGSTKRSGGHPHFMIGQQF